MSTGPLVNSSAPTTFYPIGGVYNLTSPAPIPGQVVALQLDAFGNILVNIAAGSLVASNPSVGLTGAAAPTSATEIGMVDALGKLQSISLTNPLPIVGSISVSNPSVGLTGAAVPGSADYSGVNIGGNLVGVTGLALGGTTKAPTVAIVDGSGNQITSFGGGTQFADNTASGATPTGTLSMGWDSVNSKVRALKVDASQNLDVNVQTIGTVAVTGTFFQATQPVSLAAGVDVSDRVGRLLGHVTVDNASIAVTGTFFQATQPVSIAAAVDVSDRAARLLGVVYGSQAQQLKQTATNFNLQTELATGGTLYDARQIRALTSADVVSAAQSGLWNVNQAIGVAGFGKVTDGTNTAAVKAASIAAVATDQALVVAISPNNSVAVTGTFFQATQPVSGTVFAKLEDGAGNAITSDVRGSERPLSVQILDASGNQITAFGGSGGNAAASPTGAAVPADADYVGFDSGGNLVGVSSSNPLPILVQNAFLGTLDGADGPTGTALPGYASYAAAKDVSGNLAGLALDSSGNLQVGINALVNDAPNSYFDGVVQPLSMTPEGRLRVSTVQGDIEKIWTHTFSSPFEMDDAWGGFGWGTLSLS